MFCSQHKVEVLYIASAILKTDFLKVLINDVRCRCQSIMARLMSSKMLTSLTIDN
jgi:hypothetical protein